MDISRSHIDCRADGRGNLAGVTARNSGAVSRHYVPPAERYKQIGRHRTRGISVRRGCALIGLARTTVNDIQTLAASCDSPRLISTIYDAFECSGYRRLMRGHGLKPRRRRLHSVTTDSDRDGPIFPDLAHVAVLGTRCEVFSPSWFHG